MLVKGAKIEEFRKGSLLLLTDLDAMCKALTSELLSNSQNSATELKLEIRNYWNQSTGLRKLTRHFKDRQMKIHRKIRLRSRYFADLLPPPEDSLQVKRGAMVRRF
jgi:hypothetical protein